MAKKKNIPAPTPEKLKANGAFERNQLLREWISDDKHRNRLFELVNGAGGRYTFPSRDASPRENDSLGLDVPRPEPVFGHRDVTLVTDRATIEKMLLNAEGKYSSRVYAELGGGSFMLALDPQKLRQCQVKPRNLHEDQRSAFGQCFPGNGEAKYVAEVAYQACKAAAILSLRAQEFDLALLAEQAALRFCQKLMGYSLTDFPLLEGAIRAGYSGLVYQVLGRHFVTDPTAIPAARAAMGKLVKRTSTLINAYHECDHDELKGTKDLALPRGFEPVMSKLGKHVGGDMSSEQRAILVAGSALGTVGNVQAAVCIAIKSFFEHPERFADARKLAARGPSGKPVAALEAWKGLIQGALRENPPIPFLPRLKVDENGERMAEYLLALGGATNRSDAPDEDDPLVWGLSPQMREGSLQYAPHWCLGKELAWPLIVEIVRLVMQLPALEERLDPEDASVIGLKKRWGFACESYPLTYQRDRRVAQSSLNVAMRLKSPVKDNADRVREIIRAGAPRIEEVLHEARHVHFAWFELIEGDTVLVLHTVYDGPFAPYIQHFALKTGDLFDALFQCIENPPPMPVDKFPNEFVAHIQRYDRAPAMGYFFSAYPNSEVAHILRDADVGMGRP